MAKYNVLIEETLSKTVDVEAKDYSDAISKVRKMYKNEEIVLTADDFSGHVEFDVLV